MNQTIAAVARLRLNVAVPFVSLLTVIGIASLTSNIVLVLLIIKTSTLRTGYHVFVLHGALADLAITIASVPFWILTTIYNDGKSISQITCKVNASLTFIDMIAPIFFLIMVTGQRHCSLVDPKHCTKIFSVISTQVMIVVAWLAAILLSLPPQLAWEVPPQKQCLPDFTSNIWYTGYIIIFIYLFPSGVSICVHIYDIICFRPGRCRENRQSLFKNCKKTSMTKDEMEAQKAIFALVLIQTACWLPLVIVSLAQTGNANSLSLAGLSANFIALTAGLSSTALKGISYCVQHPQIWNLLKNQCHNHNNSNDTEDEEYEMHQIAS